MIVYVRDVVFRRDPGGSYESVSTFGGGRAGRSSGRGMLEVEFTLTMDDEAADCVRGSFDSGNGADLLIALGRGLAEQRGEEFNVRTRVVVKEVEAPTYTTAQLQSMLNKALAAERAKARSRVKAPIALRELDLDDSEDDRDLREG